jgi:DNA-3-methyladenine glycosylase I
LYLAYHDREWGRPFADDRRLFENLSLDGFQAGLSWITILRKREAFRRAFSDFDLEIVAAYGPQDVERLMGDAGIVRNRAKIEATIRNARAALALIEERGSLAAHLWSFAPPLKPPDWPLPATSPEGDALSRDLKRRGWTFVGPTIIYAFMQAVGMVNDHLPGCAVRDETEGERAAFDVPVSGDA